MGNDNISIRQLTLNELCCFLIALENIKVSLDFNKNQCISKHLGQLFNHFLEWNLILLQIKSVKISKNLHIRNNCVLNEAEIL